MKFKSLSNVLEKSLAWGVSPFLILIIPPIFQLAVSSTFGLGVDEAHYMVYGRYLDWSYFDHPPLVGWIHFIFNHFFGESEFAARLPAILIGYATSCCLYLILQNRMGPQEFKSDQLRIGVAKNLWTVLTTVMLFQIFILNLFLLPDTFLLLFGALLVLLCDQISKRGQFTCRIALGLGFILGLSALSKFTAILFVFPLAIFLLQTFGLKIVFHKSLWVMVVIAALGTLPVLIWNQAHDWISFKYQSNHVLSGHDSLRSFFQSLGMQLGLITPWFWLVSLWGFYRVLKSPDEIFLKSLLATVAVFFIFASFRSTVLPHWTAVFYQLAFLFGAYELVRIFPRAFSFFSGLQILLLIFVSGVFISGESRRFPEAVKEIEGWPEIMKRASTELQKNPGAGFAVFNWTYGSRAFFYGGKAGMDARKDIFILDDRFDQFDLWNPSSPQGRDILILSFSYDELNPSKYTCAGGLGEDQKIPIRMGNDLIYTAALTWCRGFH